MLLLREKSAERRTESRRMRRRADLAVAAESGEPRVPPTGFRPSRSRATWPGQARRCRRLRQMSRLSRSLRPCSVPRCPRRRRIAMFLGDSDRAAPHPGPAVLYVVTRSIEMGRRGGHRIGRRHHDGHVHVRRARDRRALLADPRLDRRLRRGQVRRRRVSLLLGVRRLLGRGLEEADEDAVPRTRRRAYTQGIFVNLTNPKTIVFIFAFIPQFVDPNARSRGCRCSCSA